MDNPENDDDIPYLYVFSKEQSIEYDATAIKTDPKYWNWLKYKANKKKNVKNDINPLSSPLVKSFNENYGRLLISLQDILGNGNIQNLQKAIGLMRQLQVDFNYCLGRGTVKAAKFTFAPNWIPPKWMFSSDENLY